MNFTEKGYTEVCVDTCLHESEGMNMKTQEDVYDQTHTFSLESESFLSQMNVVNIL